MSKPKDLCQCGKDKAASSTLCRKCYLNHVQVRKNGKSICSDCNKAEIVLGRRICPACLYKRTQKDCPECGGFMSNKSSTCIRCRPSRRGIKNNKREIYCFECEKWYTAKRSMSECPECRNKNKPRYYCSCGKEISKGSTYCRKCSGLVRRTRKVGDVVSAGNGYMKVYVPSHINAVNGYVLEHRLVAEVHNNNQPLDSSMTVHHKNGIKDYNLQENLEIRIGNHGPGQTKEDLLSWANEIIKTHGN